MEIRYVTGDATDPSRDQPAVIVHVCNDIGGWGRGFVVALSKRWKEPERRYRDWHAGKEDAPFALGQVQFVPVESGLWVANLVGQRGLKRQGNAPPVRYDSIREGLSRVAAFAREHGASVNMPRIGCGLAGGEWDVVGRIVEEELVSKGVPVTVLRSLYLSMSLLFVLLIMGVLGCVAAVLASPVLALGAHLLRLWRCGAADGAWTGKFALFPFVALLYGMLAFGAYGAWCVGVRGVDPGIGDGFIVPLPNGYSFEGIDTLEQPALIHLADGGDETAVRLAVSGPYVFAENGQGRFYFLNTRTRALEYLPTEAALAARVRQRGGGWHALESPSSFYYARRGGVWDVLALLLMLGVPAAAFIWLLQAFVRDTEWRRLQRKTARALEG